MRLVIVYILMLVTPRVFAQSVNHFIGKGNEAYRSGQFDKAIEAYKKALEHEPDNGTAAFNLGNALFKNKNYEKAAETYETAAARTNNTKLRSQLLYNRGVVLTTLKARDESITAYEQALRLNASDTLARENLQRALNERKQQQQEEEKRSETPKENKPRPQTNKLNQQQIEQLLRALEEQERKLHDQMMKKVPVPNQPKKDW